MCDSPWFIEVAVSLANLSTCVNSAANFLVYMLRGKKFRDMFLETYCRCCGGANRSGPGLRRRRFGRSNTYHCDSTRNCGGAPTALHSVTVATNTAGHRTSMQSRECIGIL
jgi:hypothetical protein